MGSFGQSCRVARWVEIFKQSTANSPRSGHSVLAHKDVSVVVVEQCLTEDRHWTVMELAQHTDKHLAAVRDLTSEKVCALPKLMSVSDAVNWSGRKIRNHLRNSISVLNQTHSKSPRRDKTDQLAAGLMATCQSRGGRPSNQNGVMWLEAHSVMSGQHMLKIAGLNLGHCSQLKDGEDRCKIVDVMLVCRTDWQKWNISSFVLSLHILQKGNESRHGRYTGGINCGKKWAALFKHGRESLEDDPLVPETKTKQQWKQWKHSDSLPPKKAKAVQSSVLRGSKEIIMIDYLAKGRTLFKSPAATEREKKPDMAKRKVELHHDSALLCRQFCVYIVSVTQKDHHCLL
ncbi:hypothetical protein ANN_05652 [Periplaneta americana]|uniref:Uncharacterized protein n=1 Tax=Periplaneta americana TaxID=6978 RepID=A0ABQ8TDW6_PERAM|nr:hypothetical protein ANN_05652 [Periplaneta americana]